MSDVFCAFFLFANIAVFGLTLNLYTEFFKQIAQQRRVEKGGE